MSQMHFPFIDELIVDNFAGGGGASEGIERALGRPVDIAINHDPEAIAMHKANHPKTYHYCGDVFDVVPRDIVKGRSVGLAWFSPDCKHFSKAKGSKPVSKKIRGLAWVAVRWAKQVKPRIIVLENVEEFQEWGPLTHACDQNGKKQFNQDGSAKMLPCPINKGMTFHKWRRDLESCGYEVDYRELRACDYGAPTIRKRLFVIARRDGKQIVWPAPTHGDDLEPYRTAAECIDWSIPCPSIFERKRPLVENTMKRIAKGIQRYVLDAAEPFIIRICQTGWNGRHAYPMGEPLTTIVSKNEHCLVVPSVIKHYGGMVGTEATKPFPTITSRGTQNQLLTAFLVRHFGQSVGQSIKKPCPTVMSDGLGKTGVVAAHLTRFNGKSDSASPAQPAPTITGKNKTGVVTSHLIKLRGTCKHGQDMRQPMPTITAGGLHVGEVRAFLIKYYGTAIGQSLKAPLHSITSKSRFGLVTIEGEEYQIADIGMRMLSPRELFTAQGFKDDYIINPEVNGKPLTKTAQVRMCGNSVSPNAAEAIVRANAEIIAEKVAV